MVLTIENPAGTAARKEPEFIRLPKARERDPYFGLSRSYLNELVLACKANNFRPLVRSAVLRRRGAKSGVRLVHLQSLRDFVTRHEVVFEPAPTPAPSLPSGPSV
jgi:hypothetical protein